MIRRERRDGGGGEERGLRKGAERIVVSHAPDSLRESLVLYSRVVCSCSPR